MDAPAVEPTDIARYFDPNELPALAARYLPTGALALADIGPSTGRYFDALEKTGTVGEKQAVYAVALDEQRIAAIAARWPFVIPVVASPDHVPQIPSGSVDFVISAMTLEKLPDERRYLDEIRRVLKPSGRAYLTTVFKRWWAWYPRRRDRQWVLRSSHLREYDDLGAVKRLLMERDRFARLLDFVLVPMWQPVLDPVLSRIGKRLPASTVRLLRKPRVPIPGYYSLEIVVEA